MVKRWFWMGLSAAVSGCVAPEPPSVPRVNPPVAAKPANSTATYEDAPLPNRKLGAPTGNSIIKVAH